MLANNGTYNIQLQIAGVSLGKFSKFMHVYSLASCVEQLQSGGHEHRGGDGQSACHGRILDNQRSLYPGSTELDGALIWEILLHADALCL